MSMLRAERRLLAMIAAHPGQRLPSERDLAADLGIGRQQLRGLLRTCAERSLIDRRHGSGTWAADRGEGRLRHIALVFDAALRLSDDPFFAAVLEAIQQAVQDAAATCSIVRYPGAALEADAMIIIGHDCGGPWRESRLPRVAWLVDAALPGLRASVVELDDARAGTAAVERLTAGDVRRVLFAGNTSLPNPRERCRGAESAAMAAGISFSVWEVPMNFASGLELAARLPDGVEGVIAANDWLAAGIRSGLLAGRRSEVKVIGFDGLGVASSLGVDSMIVPIASIAVDLVGELRRLAASPAAAGRRLVYPLAWPVGGEVRLEG
jgi:DNA-binding LacI/PurR family transcriptional regulator